MSNSNTRKSCVVPKCTNTTTNAPGKLFFIVPKDDQMRKKWIKAMKRLDPFGDKSTVYCCEDHFDIENDMENYIKYKMVGGRLKLKKGIVPHKFKCQQEKEDKPERFAVQKQKPARTKAGVELDKFKRRLIRAVARLLVHEKKPEEEIWKELKKETGCDCQLLWTRMRALTLKKLDRLLAADDCMDAVPKAARMSLTDWLLFDLVLVHQKIDLIGQNNTKDKEDRPVLVELYDLVMMFNLESLSGDKLAEAWSMATLYYNKKGHHCSPMLLQRRWYQLKEVTRFKFYDFWYAYRGNLTRINFAEPFRPSALQTEIAKTFKLLVTEPFPEWEELIQRRRVTLPQEFERKMKERAALMRPVPKPTEDVPDLVMIEPRIETIDLRLEPDDDAAEDNKQEEKEEVILPPLVKIKQEPRDDIEADRTQLEPPKKSLYEVVLETTSLENEQLDSMDAADFDPENADVAMETDEAVREEEESVLPQIASVFGNVSDTSVLANIDEDRVYGSAENTVCSNVDDSCEDSVRGNDKDTGDCDIVEDEIARGSEKESSASHNIDVNRSRNNDAVIEVSSDDKEADNCDNVENVSENVGAISPGGGVSDQINEISDDDDISGYVDANNDTDNAKDILTDNVQETNITGNVDETNVFGNVICNVTETSVTGTVEVSGDVVKTNVTGESENVGTAVETSVSGIDEVIGNVNETSVTANVEDTTKVQDIVFKEVPGLNTETAFPTIVAALKNPSTTVTNTTEVIKDIEIIENISDPVVITDSDDDDHNVDDLVIYKPVPKSTNEEIVPKDNKDQPMEFNSTPEDLDISLTEPTKVTNLIKDAVNAEDSVKIKVEIDIKPDVKSFNFGELSNDISFVDEGIEFVDDGIAYVDEDGLTETKIKCEEEDEDEDTPKIDAKLLMCPVVYTTRLDDMGLFHSQINHMYINDKHLLDAITKKSKPIKKEPENDSKDTVENVTVNYCGETIESVTVNDREKIIEYVQKIVDENVLVKDSIIIKKEPDNVQSETIEDIPKHNIVPIEDVPKDNIVPIEDVTKQNIVNVEYKPENDNNVTSDDDEENVIDESQKVKPTSYLLQKPRSRKYHPIQLCKNPDFNTRLRRLSVGFFGSPRNRVLIKSCKPLTIDLSKAFESKLVSGTLYLKPVDHNVVTEIIDDTESHNVSVVPSAMPAQSLIDNSKVTDILPMLQQCLEASKQPENVPTSERNKVINLPDITEIRRINQRLLTAEVTPIQVQNNQPQVPVTIVTTSNTSTYPAHKTRTNAETDTDLRSIVPEATDARGPPKLLDITDDPPAKKSFEYFAGKYNDSFRQPGRPPRMMNGKRLIPPKPAVWKPRQFRPAIPWLPKNYDANTNSKKTEETLLTLDALNKMLFLLTDKLEPEELAKKPKPKPNRKISGQLTKRGRPKLTQNDSRYVVLLKKAIEEDEELNSTEDSSKCQKPKINIKAATNYRPDRDKSGVAETEQPKKKSKYCCWARQRMLQLLFSRKIIPPHGCRKLCLCCCSNLLRDYTLNEQINKTKFQLEEAESSLDKESVVSGRALSSESVKAGVENPVQSSVEISVQVPDVEIVHVPDVETDQGCSAGMVSVPEDTPIIDVDATFIESTTNTTTQNEPIDIEAMDTEGDVPVPACEVSVTTTGEVAKLPARGIEAPVNVTAKRRLVAVPIVKNQNFISLTNCISSDDQSGGVILNAMKTPNTAITPTISSPPPLQKFLAIKKSKAPSRFKTNMPLSPIMNKPFEPPKHFKEKMIFLNSKQISEKPSKSPVFLGKNKILLTTVKFPPNLKLFEEAKKALRPTLKLPDGVRLVLLSDGTIVYKIDENVAVNAMEVMEVPAIIATVQAYMDTQAAQEEALKNQKGVKESEVVDLIDDDDECAPDANDNENYETSLGTEVQTTEETAAININDFPKVSHNSQTNTSNETEENCTDSNINSDVTETESNKNESADQYTVTEIQKDVQESSQNETLSASTEQVQDQSDPISQTVSAEKDDHTKLSSLAGSEVHEVSAEQAQNQSDPTSQSVSAEKDDQPQPSNQTELTDVHEVSAEQAQNQSDLTSQSVSAEKDDQPRPSNQTELTDVHEVSSEQTQDQSDLTSQTVSAEKDDQSKPSSQTERTDVHEVSSEQAQNQSEPLSQNVSIEVKDHLETAAPEESTREPSKPKTKNILSDLMEMSGIFDEDMTSEIEETHAAQAAEPVVLTQASFVAPLPASDVEELPAPVSTGTSLARPILIPANFNRDNPLAPKLQSPIGELSPITSLYELKYACANKGLFFKLDFETGYLVPINVCMKPTVLNPMQSPAGTKLRTIAPKSVIDLTEDDDKPEQKDTEPDTSPSKRSLLLVNNSPDTVNAFSGPVKPVKMFKALKPSILQKLNRNKIQLESKNPSNRSTLHHKIKRKQFLKKINLNADSDDVFDDEPNSPVPVRRYVKRIKAKRNSIKEGNESTPTTSLAEPYKEFATTILSDDDSSDDEPLAKIAKRKHDNVKAPESGTMCIELELPAADVQPEAPVENQNESGLPSPGVEQVFMSVDDNHVVEREALAEKQTESESPVDDSETFYMSDDYNDSIDLQAPFGFESNEEDEDCCILGV